MYDLREHKELISQLVSEANQNDENWRWSVKSVGKEKARIFWEYLEYCGQKELHSFPTRRSSDLNRKSVV